MTFEAIVFDAYGTLYDTQSVAGAVEAAFPGNGDTISQVWRLKQLEYSWLRALMGRYQDFRAVTRDSLRYTIEALGLEADGAQIERVVAAYDALSPYLETEQALGQLAKYRRAILSNGSPDMLEALVRNSGIGGHLEAVISVDAKRTYKPDPRAYELVQERLGVPPVRVVFVSSNGFDIAGAKSFGFTVVRIARPAPAPLQDSLTDGGPIGTGAMFRALRMQTEALGLSPDATVGSLLELAAWVATSGSRPSLPI